MTTSTVLRTFIAIPLPPPIIAQLDRIQRRLQHMCPDRCIRWVNPRTIHLTLFFIGDMAEARVPQIDQVLTEITASIITFTFTVENLGAFPNTRRPNVIWVGIGKDNNALEDLHRTVNTGMESIGFPAEKRKFTPHLTLGRINRRTSREDRAAIGDVISKDSVGLLGTVQVTELVLFQSILKHTGAEHYPLAKFTLQS